MKDAVLATLALGLAGGLTTLLCSARAEPVAQRAPAPPAPSAAAVEVDDLRAELARVELTLARLEARELPSRAPDVIDGDTVAGALADLASEVAKLRSQVAELCTAPPTILSAPSPSADLAALRRAKPEVDWPAWDRVAEIWRRDPGEARELLRFLSPADLLETYGPPTAVDEDGDGAICWTYRSSVTDAVRAYRVRLELLDGYVTNARVCRP